MKKYSILYDWAIRYSEYNLWSLHNFPAFLMQNFDNNESVLLCVKNDIKIIKYQKFTNQNHKHSILDFYDELIIFLTKFKVENPKQHLKINVLYDKDKTIYATIKENYSSIMDMLFNVSKASTDIIESIDGNNFEGEISDILNYSNHLTNMLYVERYVTQEQLIDLKNMKYKKESFFGKFKRKLLYL